MSCDLPNLQSDDTALIGACRRLLALDGVVQAHDGQDTGPDGEAVSLMCDEWWALLAEIAPIPAATDAGRAAKIHAAKIAIQHSQDGFSELADALVKSALSEICAAHPFAGSPLRPDEIEALRRLGAQLTDKALPSDH